MEKDVEKLYEDVLNSINCENDEFISSYFKDDEYLDKNQENIMLNDEFDEQTEEKIEILPVENYVDNLVDMQENEEKQHEISVENYENEFNNNDFASLLSSSVEFDNAMVESNRLTEKSFKDNVEEEIFIEEPLLEQIELEENKEVEELTNDDILNLIDKTNNSEEFFEKLEDKLDD